MSGRRARLFWLALALTLLAAAVRVYGLDHQPLRGDEAFSVRLGAFPLEAMFAAMAASEPNPALQYLFIKYWMEVAGRGEFAVRLPSALAGVLTAALTFRVGVALAGRRAAPIATLWAALNPFLVWFAQDVRVYAIFTAVATAAAWATWRAARHNRPRYWIVAGGLWWLALGLHYFTAFSIAAAGVALLIAPGTRPRWRPAMLTLAGVGLAYLPWAVYVWPLLAGHSKSWIPPLSAAEALTRTFTSFSAGGWFAGATTLTLWAGGATLAASLVGGSWLALRRDWGRAVWMLALGPGVPLVLFALSLWRPVFLEQYAIAAVPWCLSLAAIGAASGRGRLGHLLVVFALAAVGVTSILHYRFDPAYRKAPDWRALSGHIAATARAGEIVLINQPDPAFEVYHRAPLPFEDAPPVPWAEGGQAAAEAQLSRVRDSYQHVRLLFAPNPIFDPEGYVSRWLEGCCEKTGDEFVDAFRVQSFDTPAGSLAARAPLEARFANGLTLTGFRFVSAAVPAGETAHLTLFWTTEAAVTDSYTVFVHVLAADGFQLAGADGLPRNGARLTSQWQPGEVVVDPHLISLPADLPPGEYAVEVGLYRLESGERVRLGETDRVRLPQPLAVIAR